MFGRKSTYQEDQVLAGIRQGGRARRQAEEQLFDRFTYLIPQGKKKHGLSEENSLDAYTDAIMVVIEQVASGTFRQENRISTLLHRIFFNKCVDVFRRESNTAKKVLWVEDYPSMPDRAQDIVRQIAGKEDLAWIMAQMEQLGSSCKEILWDTLYLGFKPGEVAEKMGFKKLENATGRQKLIRMTQQACPRTVSQTLDRFVYSY